EVAGLDHRLRLTHRPLPGAERAVEHRHGLVAQPAGAPPGPGGEGAAGIVVHHDLIRIVDPPGAEPIAQPLPVRQGVAATGPGRSGEVVVEAGVTGAGNVTCGVGAGAEGRVPEARPAVEDAERWRLAD